MSPDPWGVHEAAAWFAFVVIVAALYGLSRLWERRHKGPAVRQRRAQGRSVVGDVASPGHVTDRPYLGTWECWTYRCDRTADTWVFNPHAGDLFVCHKCAHEGAAHGWWAITPRSAA